MYCIHVWVRCSGRFSEVLSDELENTELAVEELVSQALLEFFRMVVVEKVTIKFSSLGSDFEDDLSPGA